MIDASGQVWVWGGVDGPEPVQVSVPGRAVAVAGGEHHKLVLDTDGHVWERAPEYAAAEGEPSLGFRQQPDLEEVIGIAAGPYHSLAVDADGHVWTWSETSYSADFALPSPVIVEGLEDIVAVAGGDSFSLALDEEGRVWSWGYNTFGQLGDGTTTTRFTPALVLDLVDITAIKAGRFFGLALDASGTLWAWGANEAGELGDGSTSSRNVPAPVLASEPLVLFGTGAYHSLALGESGQVWAWGYNEEGQLGVGYGSGTLALLPVPVYALKDVVALSGGREHSLAVLADGALLAWGAPYNGQLGYEVLAVPTPESAVGLEGIVDVEAGHSHGLARDKSGRVWSWGYNFGGQLGDGTTLQRSIPMALPGLAPIVDVAANFSCSLAADEGGKVWQWGSCGASQSLAPVQVEGLEAITTVVAAEDWTMALDDQGRVWSWGCDLIEGECSEEPPEQVQGLPVITELSVGQNHALALDTDGDVWLWGSWQPYDLEASPTRVSGLSDIRSVVAGSYVSLAVDGQGNVWGWGYELCGLFGAAGSLVTTPMMIPELAGRDRLDIAISPWAYDTTGEQDTCDVLHMLALDNADALSARGGNLKGQLGVGDLDPRSSLAEVAGLPPIRAFSTGYQFSLAVAEDGRVLGWGTNYNGETGNGGQMVPHMVTPAPLPAAPAAGTSAALPSTGHRPGRSSPR